MRVKKALKYLVAVLVFAAIYSILREQLSLVIFASGCVIALAALWLTDRFLLREKYIQQFTLKPFRFIGYLLYLLAKILVSGVKAAYITLFTKADYAFFSYASKLNDDFKLNLLASSITLTPGTVTVDRDSQRLLIIQLIRQDASVNLADIEQFEQRLENL